MRILLNAGTNLNAAAQVSITADELAVSVHTDLPSDVIARCAVHNLGNSRWLKQSHLLSMAVVEAFALGHAVELTLAWGLQVRDPVVVLPLKQFLVELLALFLSVNKNDV